MVSQSFYPAIIQEDTPGDVYGISSGSGGFKASHESIVVRRGNDGNYTVKYFTPISSTDLLSDIPTARDAIEYARNQAEDRISYGMPGSGYIDCPDFDMGKIPPEPED